LIYILSLCSHFRKLLKIVKQESKKGIVEFLENVLYQLIFLSLDKLFQNE
jgi:hypothetical protein